MAADDAETMPRPPDADALFTQIDVAARSLQVSAADPSSETVDAIMSRRIDDEFADLRFELSTPAATPDSGSSEDAGSADEPLAPARTRPDDEPDPEDGPAQVAIGARADAADEDANDDGGDDSDAPSSWPDADAVEVAEAGAAVDAPANGQGAPTVTTSDEGVVAAYNVGDSSYAMFGDGRIRVSTPDGQFMLGSMDELKSFMAARRAES